MAVLDELLVGLGFEYDPKDLEKFNKDLNTATDAVKVFAKAAIAGSAALLGFTAATTAATDEQGKLSNQTGVSVGDIDALGFALKRAGGNAESIGSSLSSLAVKISEATRGAGSGVEAFGILGISVTDLNGKMRNTKDVLLDVAESLTSLDKAQQIELAEKLGLRESILLLQEGRQGIEALTAEARSLGVTTEEDVAISAEFQDRWTDLVRIFKQVSRVITRALAPVISDLADGVKKWWLENREAIEQNLPKYIDRAAKAIKLLSIGVAAFVGYKLGSVLIGLATAFKTFGAAALAAQIKLFAIPIAIGLIAAAIIGLIDDAKTFFNGGDSLIGRLIERFPEWKTALENVAAVFAVVGDLLQMAVDGWIGLFKLFFDFAGDVFSEIGGLIKLAVNGWQMIFEKLKAPASAVFEFLKNAVVGFVDSVISLLSTVGQFIIEIFEKLKAPVSAVFDFLKNAVVGFVDSTISLFAKIGQFVDEVFNSLAVIIAGFVDAAFNLIADFVKTLGKMFADIWNAIPDFNLLDSFNFDELGKKFDQVFGDIKSALSSPIDFIFGDDDDKEREVKTTFKNTVETIQAGVKSQNADQVLRGLATDQVLKPNLAASTTNNSKAVNVDLGGIKVEIKGQSGQAQAQAQAQITGREIAESIRRELAPMLKDASYDLNSAVEI